jgi:DNA-binding transcriptional LysR family regulator
MRYSLRQLQIFEAVARHLSYTRAAEALHLTQPAVFAQIKQLEEVIGLPLLERIGKQIHLTAFGREVLATSRETLDALERLEMRLADMQGLKRGRLRIAMVTTAKYLLPRLLGEFCARYPGIEAELIVSNREKLLARLANNEDDLAILGAPPDGLDVIATPIADNPLVVLARHDHPLAGKKRISPVRVAEEPFILREKGSGTRLATERHFAELGQTLKVRMELGSNEAIKQAIAGGLGISVLSRHTLTLEGEVGLIQPLDVQGFPLLRKWYVAYPKGKHLSAVAEAFMKHLLPTYTAFADGK